MTILLALLGLNFLIFMHELGHYLVARRKGMKVEVFSIGFGKPLWKWESRGVTWQICPLLFGGYVKIAGMDFENRVKPQEIAGGFYSKTPWARIQVLLAGPFANFLIAFVLFGVVYFLGGREKSFAEFTRLIGWVEPSSELYQKGVRPGDEITQYNGATFQGYKDLMFAAITRGNETHIEGNKIDYFDEKKIPYDYKLTPYHSVELSEGMTTVGILAPAHYLIYDGLYQNGDSQSSALPMAQSGIQKGDRIVWVDGELVFSQKQLDYILNDNKVLLTIEREGKTLLYKISRLSIRDLRMTCTEKEEIEDWIYAAKMSSTQKDFCFIPYVMTFDLFIEKGLDYIDQHSCLASFNNTPTHSPLESVLKKGDRILAVDGVAVHSGAEFVQKLQTRHVPIIVQRGGGSKPVLWVKGDHMFESETDWNQITPIINSLGTSHPIQENGSFHLLHSVTPIPYHSFPFSEKDRILLSRQMRDIQKIKDSAKKEAALEELKKQKERLILGIQPRDRLVVYNPNPWHLFSSILSEMKRTLFSLFSGSVSPKHLGGPILIAQVMERSWSIGVKEALFWLGAISLNLGVFNLLPIPALDGGYVCFSLIEWIRRKPLHHKTVRRSVFVFFTLLLLFAAFVTYHDILRLFDKLF